MMGPGAAEEARSYARHFGKVVVWGLRRQWHSHRFIHKGFAQTLHRLGIPVVWTDYTADPSTIEPGDFVISSSATGRGTRGDPLAPLCTGAYYCFHGFAHSAYLGTDRRPQHDVDHRYQLNLETFVNGALDATDRWDTVTYFDRPSKTLYQPWGTNLIAEDFRTPIVPSSRLVFWVGAIWANEFGQGNRSAIDELREVLKRRSLRFVHLQYVPDLVNISAIRRSRIAPAIAGESQVTKNYLPCRMFKNISYGQLGISNVPKFAELYRGCCVEGESIAELVDRALFLRSDDAIEIIREQQAVTREHTYVQKIRNIFRAMLEY